MEPLDTDYTLILACRSGDARAWEQVLERYERLVFSIPLSYGLPREAAADVVQLTFTALIERLDTLSADSRLSAWLGTVARRYTWRALEAGRREYVDSDEPLPERGVLLGSQSPDPLERWELVEWIDRGLARLNDRCRALLRALYFEPSEPSYTDVAARLGVSPGSIGPTRARCLDRLRAILQES